MRTSTAERPEAIQIVHILVAALVTALIAASSGWPPAAPSGKARGGVAIYEGLVYSPEHGLALDIYQPPGKRNPVLVLVHGGSWQRGSSRRWTSLAPRFARAGFVVVAIDYRLAKPAGDATFPEPVDDLLSALRWVRNEIHAYGGDSRRVAMAGTSAGAHLALHAAAARKGPDAVALFSPPVDLVGMHRRNILSGSIEKFMGCFPEECPASYSQASALTAAGSTSAPVLLAYSLEELVPKDHSRRLARSLRGRSSLTEVLEAPGGLHAMPLVDKFFEETVSFLRGAFKRHRIG